MAKYKVVSAIKFKGKIREEGAIVEMPAADAVGLHVELVSGQEAQQGGGKAPDDDGKGKK